MFLVLSLFPFVYFLGVHCEQQLALKLRVHCGISIVFLQMSLYSAFRDTCMQQVFLQ